MLTENLLTAQQVSEWLQVPKARVYELVRLGLLPGGVRIDRQLRLSADEVRNWIAGGGAALPGGWRRSDEPILEKEESHGKR